MSEGLYLIQLILLNIIMKVISDPKNKKVELQLNHLDKITTRGIRQAFYQIGTLAIRTINENVLKKPRSGKVYKRKGRRHSASVAGESFANRSGKARNTRGFDVRGAQEVEFGFRDKDNTDYTAYLENGTRKMQSRPTVGIASRSTQGRAITIMKDELKKAHKEGYK